MRRLPPLNRCNALVLARGERCRKERAPGYRYCSTHIAAHVDYDHDGGVSLDAEQRERQRRVAEDWE